MIEGQSRTNKMKEATIMTAAVFIGMKEVMVIMFVTAIIVSVALLRRRH